MDVSDHEAYELTIAEAAALVIARVDCSCEAVTAELQTQIDRLQNSDLVRDRCSLILGMSDSPVAQSFRNARQVDRNAWKWAGLALSHDVRHALRDDFEFRRSSSDPSGLRDWVLTWQQEILRGDFPDDVPWSVIADWYDDLADPVRASQCRRFLATGD